MHQVSSAGKYASASSRLLLYLILIGSGTKACTHCVNRVLHVGLYESLDFIKLTEKFDPPVVLMQDGLNVSRIDLSQRLLNR